MPLSLHLLLLCSANSASATFRDLFFFARDHLSFIGTGHLCWALKKPQLLKILRVRKKHLPRVGQDKDGEDTGLPKLEKQESYLKSPTYLTLDVFQQSLFVESSRKTWILKRCLQREKHSWVLEPKSHHLLCAPRLVQEGWIGNSC